MKISNDISLEEITTNSFSELYLLMKRIYYPVYKDYWEDEGEWYLNQLYNKENIQKELEEEKSKYFFIVSSGSIIGIIRIVFEIDMNYKYDSTCVKLHRLYLDQEFQNKGIGKTIMNWLIIYVREKGYQKLWLEVMDQQHQAVFFYKKLGFKDIDKVTVDFKLLHNNYRGMHQMAINIDEQPRRLGHEFST
jgi:GNAT superfamily N-acetyltransferase